MDSTDVVKSKDNPYVFNSLDEVLSELSSFRTMLESVDWPKDTSLANDRRKFILLLSGLSSFRMAPGIPVNMGHDELFECASEEDRSELKNHLKRLFDIVDEASLWRTMNHWYRSYDEYDTFRVTIQSHNNNC